MEGVQHIEKRKIIEINPLIEPDLIVFNYTGDNLSICYGKQQAVIFSRKQFINDLKKAIQNSSDGLGQIVKSES